MSQIFSIEKYDKLFEAVLSLSSLDDARRFFEDICTIRELEDISQRLEVAKMLKKGSGYAEIISTCGASTATISRVNKCLNYGKGGYDVVLGKEDEKND